MNDDETERCDHVVRVCVLYPAAGARRRLAIPDGGEKTGRRHRQRAC